MVKHILLNIDDDKFRTLKSIKAMWESGKKRDYTWEEFLVEWVITMNDLMLLKTVDKAIEEATSKIKPEHRDEIVKLVRIAVEDKLRYLPK